MPSRFKLHWLAALPTLLVVLAACPSLAHAQQQGRVALVIGNAAYPGPGALKNPANDAKDVAAKLKRLGFDVMLRTDIRHKDMLRSLTEFGDKVQPGNEALFFYAGHGMQVRGKNYLIPIDAEIRNETSVSSEAVDVDQLLDKLAPARLSMVILDACRNNPFERRFRGSGQGLAQINAPAGTLIAYATAPGKVAADGDGRNGLYTAELLSAMDVPGIKIEDVFKRVRSSVVKKSGDAQTPWESSSLTGDFYFRPTDGGPAAGAPQVLAPVDTAIELAFWESVAKANTAAEYTAYLNRFPEGQFAELARSRIASLSRTTKSALVPDIEGIWHWSVRSFLVPDRFNTIKADGTCVLDSGTTCIWSYQNAEARKLTVRFSDTWTHVMTLSEDGRMMKGTDDWGTAVTAIRAGIK